MVRETGMINAGGLIEIASNGRILSSFPLLKRIIRSIVNFTQKLADE